MATLNFDESIVLILFAQSGGGLTPSHADIVNFDSDLQASFGGLLQQIMTQQGLETDIHSRSLVLGCRPHMPGNTAALQIRNACRYIISARTVLAEAAAASLSRLELAAAPGRRERAASRPRGRTGSESKSGKRRARKRRPARPAPTE